jgi:hypothetical protein
MFRCTRIIPHYEKKVKELETLLLLTNFIERQNLNKKHNMIHSTILHLRHKTYDKQKTHISIKLYVAQNHIFVL